MKIVYLHQYFNTPEMEGSTHSCDVASMLVKKGHQVTMVTASQGKKELEKNSVNGIQIIWLDSIYSPSMKKYERIKAFLSFMIKSTIITIKTDCDMVFATSTPLTIGFPALLKKFFHKTPFIFEVRDLWPAVPIEMGVIKNKSIVALLTYFEKLIYSNAYKIFVISNGIAELINTPIEKVKVFPFGCDKKKYSQIKKYMVFKDKFYRDKIIVGLVGSIGFANDPFIILDVAESLKKMENKKIHFVFFGNGSAKEQLIKEVKMRNIKNVTIYDSVNKKDALSVAKSLDAGLILHGTSDTYRYTACPNKFFDYLYFGTHIIYNFNGPLKDELEKENIGFYFDPKASKALAKYLNNLDLNLLKKEKSKSKYLANYKYDMDVILNKMHSEIIG